MNDQRIVDYLRARGQVSPPIDFTRSVMAAIDSAPAEHSRFSVLVPALVAVGAAAVVAALALLLGPGRDVGPVPRTSAQPSARPSATDSAVPGSGRLEAEVAAALELLADSPGVQGTVTTNYEAYLASATWFDWRPNRDQVLVTRTDIDVSFPWWTDPSAFPLTVGERIETEISILTEGAYFHAVDGAWAADQAPAGPLSAVTGMLDGSVPVVAEIPAGSDVSYRDLADGKRVWVLVDGSEAGRTIREWTIGPDGVLRSISTSTEGQPTPEAPGSTGILIELSPIDDADSIEAPELGAAPNLAELGLPEDFPLEPAVVASAIQVSECAASTGVYRVTLPDGWWTNPTIEHPQLGIVDACQYFGPTEFDLGYASAEQAFPDGVAMVLRYVEGGCLGYFLAPISTRDTVLDGIQATVTEYGATEDVPEPALRYEYVVNLAPGVDCESGGRFILAGTNREMTGDYEANKAALDQMMSTIKIEP